MTPSILSFFLNYLLLKPFTDKNFFKKWYIPIKSVRDEKLTQKELLKRIEDAIGSTEKEYSRWLSQMNAFLIFLSLVIVNFIDTFSAWVVFKWHPNVFFRKEVNQLFVQALVHGKSLPLIKNQLLMLGVYIILAIGLWKLSKKRNTQIYRLLSLLPAMLGIVSIWLYSIATATNIINGMLLLDVIWPLSSFYYFLVSFPISFILLLFFWRTKIWSSLASSIVGLAILSFFI